MGKTICGIDCTKCRMNEGCKGCAETGGRPYGGTCVTAELCGQGEAALLGFRKELMAAFNSLDLPDMDEVTELYALRGAFVNLPLTLPGGTVAKFWDDDRILLGNQLEKKGTDRCYGLAADERYLMVCEYGEGGSDAQLVVFRRWNARSHN